MMKTGAWAVGEYHEPADRKVASMKKIFKEAARLGKQAKYLNQVLALPAHSEHHTELLSSTMIGFVQENEDDPTPLCAFTWTGSAPNPAEVEMILRRDWARRVPSDVFSYVQDLLNDWTETMLTNPEMVLAMIAELSIGPIRTMERDTIRRDQAALFMQERLGEVLRFPGDIPVN
jgi:hypothetical protein